MDTNNEQPPAPHTAGRDPRDTKTLEGALKVACRIVDEAPDDAEGDEYYLAAGFLLLCKDLHGYWKAIQEQKHYCGWCEHAGVPCAELTSLSLEDMRAHTVKCEHNPLVQELQRLRPLYAAAEAWRNTMKERPTSDGDYATNAQAAQEELEDAIDRAIDAEPTDNPAEWPDAGMAKESDRG